MKKITKFKYIRNILHVLNTSKLLNLFSYHGTFTWFIHLIKYGIKLYIAYIIINTCIILLALNFFFYNYAEYWVFVYIISSIITKITIYFYLCYKYNNCVEVDCIFIIIYFSIIYFAIVLGLGVDYTKYNCDKFEFKFITTIILINVFNYFDLPIDINDIINCSIEFVLAILSIRISYCNGYISIYSNIVSCMESNSENTTVSTQSNPSFNYWKPVGPTNFDNFDKNGLIDYIREVKGWVDSFRDKLYDDMRTQVSRDNEFAWVLKEPNNTPTRLKLLHLEMTCKHLIFFEHNPNGVYNDDNLDSRRRPRLVAMADGLWRKWNVMAAYEQTKLNNQTRLTDLMNSDNPQDRDMAKYMIKRQDEFFKGEHDKEMFKERSATIRQAFGLYDASINKPKGTSKAEFERVHNKSFMGLRAYQSLHDIRKER